MSRYALVTTDGVVANLYAGQHPGSIPVPEGLPVGPGWSYADGVWSPPGLDLDAALAEVDAHVDALLAQGCLIQGVRFSLATDDRVDWLGLRAMAADLLAAAGGAIPVVGVDGGLLVLVSEAQIAAAAGALAAHRLYVQALSAGARTRIRAATTSAERRAEVERFKGVS